MADGILMLLNNLILPLNAGMAIVAILVLVIKKYEWAYFATYVIIACFIEVYAFYLSGLGINNLFLFHVLTPIEFFLFSMTFRNWENKYKDLYTSAIGIITVLITIDCSIITPWVAIPVNSLVWGSLSLAVFSGRAVFSSDRDQLDRFLISMGAFMYFLINACIYPSLLTSLFAAQIRIYLTTITYVAFIVGLFYAWNRNR